MRIALAASVRGDGAGREGGGAIERGDGDGAATARLAVEGAGVADALQTRHHARAQQAGAPAHALAARGAAAGAGQQAHGRRRPQARAEGFAAAAEVALGAQPDPAGARRRGQQQHNEKGEGTAHVCRVVCPSVCLVVWWFGSGGGGSGGDGVDLVNPVGG